MPPFFVLFNIGLWSEVFYLNVLLESPDLAMAIWSNNVLAHTYVYMHWYLFLVADLESWLKTT